ncbi:nucleolar protein [Saccharomyces cerevisiae]|nr:nucleolar protein [Saccharomyces cerevisiae]
MSSEEDYFDELEYDLADEVNEEKEDIQTKKLTTVNCQTEKFNPFEILPESIELFRTLALISPDRLSLSETAQILPKIVDLKRILQQQEIDFIKLLPFFNEIIPLIKSNIKLMHNFLISLYSRRFPELSSLIPSPLQYSKVISILENENYSKNESDELFSTWKIKQN